MKLVVRLFAILRERAGTDRIELELADGATVGSLLDQLADDPRLGDVIGRMRIAVAVNRDYAQQVYAALAGGAAGLGRMAFVDVAGEAIDQPRALLCRAFKPGIAAAERVDQRRQQNCSGDHRRADQCWH